MRTREARNLRTLDGRVVLIDEMTLDELDSQRRLADTYGAS